MPALDDLRAALRSRDVEPWTRRRVVTVAIALMGPVAGLVLAFALPLPDNGSPYLVVFGTGVSPAAVVARLAWPQLRRSQVIAAAGVATAGGLFVLVLTAFALFDWDELDRNLAIGGAALGILVYACAGGIAVRQAGNLMERWTLAAGAGAGCVAASWLLSVPLEIVRSF